MNLVQLNNSSRIADTSQTRNSAGHVSSTRNKFTACSALGLLAISGAAAANSPERIWILASSPICLNPATIHGH